MKNSLSAKYSNFITNISNKKVFLVQVYATLIFQIWLAYIVLLYAENHNFMQSKIMFFGTIIALFVIIIVISMIQSPIIKFVLFCLFSGLVGLMLSYRVDLKNPEELEIVKKAFITTVCVFIFIVLFGFFLAFMGVTVPPIVGVILFFALLILIIVTFVLSLTGQYPAYHKYIAGFIIFLFSIFIAYDTMNILDKNNNSNFVNGALDYFLDFLNMFSAFLNLGE